MMCILSDKSDGGPEFLPPKLRQDVIGQANSVVLRIVRANLNTQYASKTPLLGELRNAISAHSSTSDAVLVDDFRRCVPLSNYDAYKPFMAAFNASPCKETELENLFAPGHPYLLAISSSTSGKEPKIFAKYNTFVPSASLEEDLVALVFFCGYRELKHIEGEPGRIVKKIPMSTATSGAVRVMLGWTDVDGDDARMPVIAPGFVAPFAASMIANHKSFLIIHALFTLACRDTSRIILTFSTLFYDLVRCVDEQWDMLLSSIENGTVPGLPGVHEVHSHLQVSFHANPERVAELREIGPPSSREGWAAQVWPKLRIVSFGCSGPFASVLPKVKAVVGPTVAIHTNGYGSSESVCTGAPYRPDDPHTFVLRYDDFVEFLDVTAEESHENILQAWELEVGKQYEVVLTTVDGLWRYRLGDVIDVAGFDADSGLPVFVLSGRRSLSIRLTFVLLSDTDIISAIQSVSSDIVQVSEFTTVLDDRQAVATVGYLIELAGTSGPNVHLTSQSISEGLAAANAKYRAGLENQRIRIPTVRVLRPGTFAAFRQWKAENMSVGPGQIKVPAVLLDEASRKWILERVVGEL